MRTLHYEEQHEPNQAASKVDRPEPTTVPVQLPAAEVGKQLDHPGHLDIDNEPE